MATKVMKEVSPKSSKTTKMSLHQHAEMDKAIQRHKNNKSAGRWLPCRTAQNSCGRFAIACRHLELGGDTWENY
uniref:Uncharacterized protein n=1 Tax=Megaselia scalaris TaxID=36166 RepID=T1GAH9_MEGSC